MDITFALCPNLIGLLGLGLLLIFTRFNIYLDARKLQLFTVAAHVNILIIVFEMADYLLAGGKFEAAYILRRITSATGFALVPVLPLLLAYISRKKKLSRWMIVPAAVNALLSYLSIFTGTVFTITPDNSYIRGPLFILVLLVSGFYLLMLARISVFDIYRIRPSEAVFLLCAAAIIVTGNVFEIALKFHFLVRNSCAILLIMYYLFLHIQYFKYDPLTGVFNRSVFAHDMAGLNHKSNVGVLSFDLNGLKAINDRLGHEKGDYYIVESAHAIDRSFGEAGRLFRIGGDEFVVIMTNTTEAAVRKKIDSFKKACEGTDISVACGYSFIENVSDSSQILRDADQAMYKNKRTRVVGR